MAEMKELGVVRNASPCSENWSKMKGDDQTRLCTRCGADVYDLSKTTSDEARALIRQREPGRLCVRFWKRPDGTVMTQDCPARDFRPRLRIAGATLAVMAALLIGIVMFFGDNVRRLFGMSSNCGAQLRPQDPAPRPVEPQGPCKAHLCQYLGTDY